MSGWQQVVGASKQVLGGREVAALSGTHTRRPKMACGSDRDPLGRIRDGSELAEIAAGQLEVITEDLIQLGELGPVLSEPRCEALVEFRAGRLRHRLVGGVPDEDVAEPEAVLSFEQRRVRPDHFLPNQGRQAWCDLGLLGRESLDSTEVEDLPFYRRVLEHGSLRTLKLVQA